MISVKNISAVSIATILTFTICLAIWGMWHDEWSGYNASVALYDNDSCNIGVVSIIGDIVGDEPSHDGSEYAALANVDEVLAEIAEMSWYDGAIIRIDSLGGAPVASEYIANAIDRLDIPTVAVIRDYGTSGAYLAASAADHIIASVFSDVGSIGITMSYLDYSEQNTRDGIRYVPLVSAPFKDYGSSNRALTVAERQLLERDLQVWHTEFVRQVATYRGLPQETVATLADGSSMPGSVAVETGLIDAIGDEETARAWLAEQLEMDVDDVVLCG